MSTIKVNNLTNVAGDTSVSFTGGSLVTSDVKVSTINSGPIGGFRNRIINGGMEIDQRNAGAAVSLNNSFGYISDRWLARATGGSGTGTATVQRIADAPPGFIYSLKYTVTNAKSPVSNDSFFIYQPLEGINVTDFAYGTASAKTVTLSFWVKSSLTGTFCGFLRSANSVPTYRSYVFSYTINAANTWQYITITVPGDTAQTTTVDNTQGYAILFDLGSGSSHQTSTLNAWQTGNFYRSTTSINLISTLNATFQVTGVQLELGTQATPFERRSYGEELALCQRYFEKSYDLGTAPGSVTDAGAWESVSINVTDFYDYGRLTFKVPKRATPTMTLYSTNGIVGQWRNLNLNANEGNSGANNISENGAHLLCTNNVMTANNGFRTQWTASAEL